MQSLLDLFRYLKDVSLRKTPFVGGGVLVSALILSSLAFLALPADASLESPTEIKKLNDPITLQFSHPVKRKDVNIEIQPTLEFGYHWSGVLLNQKLTIIPKKLLQPNSSYQIKVSNIKNPLGTSITDKIFSFTTEDYPKVLVANPNPESGMIKPKPEFFFLLDKQVDYGKYELVTSPSFETNFTEAGRNVSFSSEKSLKQGKQYLVYLQFIAPDLPPVRLFEGKFLVVKPLKLVKTTPKQEAQNISKKASIEFEFNKIIKPLFLESYIKIKPTQEVKFDFKNKKTIKITPKEKFKTNTDYKIVVDKSIQATDGATLEKRFYI